VGRDSREAGRDSREAGRVYPLDRPPKYDRTR
jgi:hypothetical protein